MMQITCEVMSMNGFIKALIVSLAILAVWFMREWIEFGELQWDRECDNVVFVLYFFALWYAFSKKG